MKMKLTYKSDEFGDIDVYAENLKVGEIYKSAFANYYIIEAKGFKNEGYATKKDAKADFQRIINERN